MIGVARRPGRLKLGLRLGSPGGTLPAKTLDNTLGTATIAGTEVQNFSSGWGVPVRQAAAAVGITLPANDGRAVNVIVAEAISALEDAGSSPVQRYAADGGGTVPEGNPTTVQHYAAAGGGTVAEGNPTSVQHYAAAGGGTVTEGN